MIFKYTNNYENIIYQTVSDDFPDISRTSNIFKSFEAEIKNSLNEYEYEHNYKPGSSQSGIFFFDHEKMLYCGIYCKIPDTDGQMNTIYIVTRRKTVTEIIKDDFLLYLFIWFIVLAAVAAISIRLIKKATYPTEAAILSQKNFVAAASHELKAPLAVILTNAEAIAADSSLEARL